MQILMRPLVCWAVFALEAGAALAGVSHWAVEPMSSARRLPDAEPTDGRPGGEVRLVAARGEYEPGSFVLRSDVSLDGATLTAGDLVARDGSRIPAACIDLTVVKCWYQSGTAWHGHHNDSLRHILTPELLLHDETLVKADPAHPDDYLRCQLEDGRTAYLWLDYTPEYCEALKTYPRFYPFRESWVVDAKTLQPFALEVGKCKQFWLTVHVPAGPQSGIYRGEVTGTGGGERWRVPIAVKVLPFELPAPKTFHNPYRTFYNACEFGQEEVFFIGHPRIVENMVAHNVLNPLFRCGDSALADVFSDAFAQGGMGTDALFSVLPSANMVLSDPAVPDDADYVKFRNFQVNLSNSVARLRERFGEDTVLFAYGRDEAASELVVAQRETWRAVHAAGGKVYTSSRNRPFILFSADAQQVAGAPAPERRRRVDAIHDANPDSLVGWYADPHSGPENPDFARRLYGWLPWRNGYDMNAQYVIFSHGWSEFCLPSAVYLRAMSFCYSQRDALIDTLQWEGMREGIDDIRYGTLLMRLADRARRSADVRVQYLGRAARTWLGHVDCEQSSLRSLRLEMIDRIMKLRAALGEERR